MITVQTVLPDTGNTSNTPLASNSESILDPELTDFCSRLHITPDVREFHDSEDDSDDPHLCVSNQSSEIEEETELKIFTQAFKRTQSVLERKNKKRGFYTKDSKRTQKRREQLRNKLAAKGFLPVDQYIKLKSNPEKQKELTSKSIINVDQDSSEPETLARDTYAYKSVNGTSEEESEECLPVHNIRLRPTHPTRLESKESEVDDDGCHHRLWRRTLDLVVNEMS